MVTSKEYLVSQGFFPYFFLLMSIGAGKGRAEVEIRALSFDYSTASIRSGMILVTVTNTCLGSTLTRSRHSLAQNYS